MSKKGKAENKIGENLSLKKKDRDAKRKIKSARLERQSQIGVR
jgi:hypothetical protein